MGEARLPIVEVNLMPVEDICAHWLVEALDDDGGVHRAEFIGRYAEADARIWAGAAYPETGFTVLGPPQRMAARVKPKLTVVGGKETPDDR